MFCLLQERLAAVELELADSERTHALRDKATAVLKEEIHELRWVGGWVGCSAGAPMHPLPQRWSTGPPVRWLFNGGSARREGTGEALVAEPREGAGEDGQQAQLSVCLPAGAAFTGPCAAYFRPHVAPRACLMRHVDAAACSLMCPCLYLSGICRRQEKRGDVDTEYIKAVLLRAFESGECGAHVCLLPPGRVGAVLSCLYSEPLARLAHPRGRVWVRCGWAGFVGAEQGMGSVSQGRACAAPALRSAGASPNRLPA